MKKTLVEDFADAIKDDSEEVIKWCRKEIAAYEELIKLLEDRK